MSEKQLIQEERLLKRLVISQNDLHHAQWYANLILAKKLHHSTLNEDKYLHRGLNTALIVSYWRPFSNNISPKKKKKSEKKEDAIIRLPENYLTEYTAEENNLHHQIGELRNHEVAHSDADSHQVQINILNRGGVSLAIPISRNAYIPIDQSKTEMVRYMIEKLLLRISKEQIRLQE